MKIQRMYPVMATVMAIVTPGVVKVGDDDPNGVPAFVSGSGAERADGSVNTVRKVVYPASCESVLEALAGKIVLACRRPDLQEAARLTELQCTAKLLAGKDACKSKARVLIPDSVIKSREQFEVELKMYLDCLMPQTNLAEPKRLCPEVFARSSNFRPKASGSGRVFAAS